MLKLFLYTPVFPPRVGGIETIVYSLASGLAALCEPDGLPQFQITLATPTPAGPGCDDSQLPFRILRQPGLSDLRHAILQADVIHVACPSPLPILLGLLARKPVLVEHHGFQLICPTGQLLQEPFGTACPGHFQAGHFRACLSCRPAGTGSALHSLKQLASTWIRRALARLVVANIMPTNYLASLYNLPNSVTIHHGISIPAEFVQGPLPSGPVRIVYQGRMVNSKGIAVLIDAATILHQEGIDFELRMIGDGPERTTLESRVLQLGMESKVRFYGRLPDSELAQAYQGVRIAVIPSLAGEVFGLVVTENMARGLATVVSDIGAFSEVAGTAGITFPSGNPGALADHLAQLISDRDQIPSRGLEARLRVLHHFERSQMIAAHAALYRKAVTSR